MDMFAFDSNGDRCLELHVGTLPPSDTIGRCFMTSAYANSFPLTFDYLTTQASDRSDHASMWSKNIPAVTVMENFFEDDLPGGCQGVDGNPFYHRPGRYNRKIE